MINTDFAGMNKYSGQNIKIPSLIVNTERLKETLGGFKDLSKKGEKQMVDLQFQKMKKMEKMGIDLDDYIIMEQFAQYLPRGKRKLKINIPELRDKLLSNQKLNALTDTSGLRSGGLIAMTGNNKAVAMKSTKKLKEETQKGFQFTIKNKNRIKSEVNLNGGFNPNYTSFKNKFNIK